MINAKEEREGKEKGKEAKRGEGREKGPGSWERPARPGVRGGDIDRGGDRGW
jgi:hypothetical protein